MSYVIGSRFDESNVTIEESSYGVKIIILGMD